MANNKDYYKGLYTAFQKKNPTKFLKPEHYQNQPKVQATKTQQIGPKYLDNTYKTKTGYTWNNLYQKHPQQKVLILSINPEIAPPAHEELEAYLENFRQICPRCTMYLEFVAETGIRFSELAAIKTSGAIVKDDIKYINITEAVYWGSLLGQGLSS